MYPIDIASWWIAILSRKRKGTFMSVFYSDSNPSEKSKKHQDDISTPGALALLVGLCAVIFWKKIPTLEELYFHTFKFIYFGGYVLITVLAGAAIWHITKKTKALSQRAQLLSQAKKVRGSIFTGTTDDGVDLFLSEEVRTGHVQILGSTGRGKTQSVIVPWMSRDILAGSDAILIDGKGDPEILESLIRSSNQSGMESEVHVFDLGNPDLACAINPLAHGSAQQITDRIFTAFNFDDSYYKSVQSSQAGAVIELIHSLGEVVTFKRLYELLTDDSKLSETLAKCQKLKIQKQISEIFSTPRASRMEKLSGLLSQLAPFAVGEVAELVNGETSLRKCWTVSDIVLKALDNRSQHILAILIPTLKYQQIGHQLGKLLIQELGWAIGERASRRGTTAEFLPVYLDEFSAFVYPGFTNILNKARSSRVALHLSHQALSDLSMVSHEVAETIVTNTNVKCVLGLNDPKSADYIARHIGTKSEEKFTEQAEERGMLFSKKEKTGRMSIREVEAYKIHPNLLKNFMNGRGVIHFPTPLGNISEEIQFEPLSNSELYGKSEVTYE